MFNAISFLYKHILKKPLSLELNFNKSRNQPKLPEVLTIKEVKKLLNALNSNYMLPCQLMVGSGLRLMEALHYASGYSCLSSPDKKTDLVFYIC